MNSVDLKVCSQLFFLHMEAEMVFEQTDLKFPALVTEHGLKQGDEIKILG